MSLEEMMTNMAQDEDRTFEHEDDVNTATTEENTQTAEAADDAAVIVSGPDAEAESDAVDEAEAAAGEAEAEDVEDADDVDEDDADDEDDEDEDDSSASGVRSVEPIFMTVNSADDVDIDDDLDWAPDMVEQTYFGDTAKMLNIYKENERKYKVTLPISAYGLAPEPFLYERGDSKTFEIDGSSYELLEIEGNIYASCVTDVIDADYLKSVITEGLKALHEHGEYTFELIGLRCFNTGDGKKALANTLRLNSYEMSSVVRKLGQFPGVAYHFLSDEDDRLMLYFTVE